MRQVMQTCAMGLMLLFGTAVQAGSVEDDLIFLLDSLQGKSA